MKLEIPEQMVVRTLWAVWWFLIGGAGLWLLVGAVSYWVKNGMLPPDAAGWVQAVGSVLGIAIAIAVPWNQKRHEMAVRADERRALEVAQSEQLLCLCTEVRKVVQLQRPQRRSVYDSLYAQEYCKGIYTDLLSRLTDIQRSEVNAQRLNIGLSLRFELHAWVNCFGGHQDPSTDQVSSRFSVSFPILQSIESQASEEVRKLGGQRTIGFF
ncbi:hypothetical protein [Pseudomonas fluorescens]|uniref:hypothetical protein n=1 Tax=Pseudomonas fluorescens TaxID=294 RepID=UPI001784F6A1|nr:hypothetical protein [Pseudomonas fluorescens]